MSEWSTGINNNRKESVGASIHAVWFRPYNRRYHKKKRSLPDAQQGLTIESAAPYRYKCTFFLCLNLR